MTGRRAEGRRDLQDALRLAQSDALTYAIVVSYKADPVVLGFELVDEDLVNETRDALLAAESFGDAYGLALARWAHGTALLRRRDPDRIAGLDLLHQSRSGTAWTSAEYCTDAEVAVEMARQGRRDEAIDTLRAVIQTEIDAGNILYVGYPIAVLVELLVGRGARDDVGQARDIVAQYEVRITGGLRAFPSTVATAVPGIHSRTRLATAAGYAEICHAVPRPGRRTRCSRTPRDRESASCCISRGLRRAHASVARMHTVTYGSARPVALASAGWVASSSRTRSSVWVRTSAGEVMQ